MKRKKTLFAIVAVLLVAVIGGTFAYFNSSATFDNQFSIGDYNVISKEVFTSPSNWSPGDTTPKTITAKNEGTVNAAVRIKYEEAWTDSNGDEINTIPNDAVILNFTTPSNWTKNDTDGYYYYNYYLKSGEETSSLIESVTLNSNLNNSTCVEEDGTQICTNNVQGLAGTTYTLTFTIETVQYDKYQEAWNTEQAIGEKPPLVQIMNSERNKNNLQVGDEICINGDTTECFNFIRYDGDNVVMLSKYNLNVGNNIQLGVEGIQNSLALGWNEDSSTKVNNYYPATVAFSGTNYWADRFNLKSKYGSDWDTNNIYDTDYNEASGNNYSVAYYVENYKNTLESYGLTVNDARLLTYSESIDESIGCDIDNRECPTGFIPNTSFWLGSACDYNVVWVVSSDGGFYAVAFDVDVYDNVFGVRPVIVISKSDI